MCLRQGINVNMNQRLHGHKQPCHPSISHAKPIRARHQNEMTLEVRTFSISMLIASIFFSIAGCARLPKVLEFNLISYKSVQQPLSMEKASWISNTTFLASPEFPVFSAECYLKLIDCVAEHQKTKTIIEDDNVQAADNQLALFVELADEPLTDLRNKIFGKIFFRYSKPTDQELKQLVQEGTWVIEKVIGQIPECLEELRGAFYLVVLSFLLPKVQIGIRGDKFAWNSAPHYFCSEELTEYIALMTSLSEQIDIINDNLDWYPDMH